jgi:hypothetical protein
MKGGLMRIVGMCVGLVVFLTGPDGVRAAEAGPLLAQIKAVRAEGGGNPDAAKAWRELVKLGPDVLTDILSAFDDDNPISANWLRAAVDAIAERELAARRSLPAAKLETFVLDTRQPGTARRLAYDWLARVDSTASARLIPGMLNDPAGELRRDAVALVIQEAKQRLEQDDKPGATAAFARALAAARDRDQVIEIAAQLKKLGIAVDLAAQFGFIRDWRVMGPFDNTGGVGFKAVYPPELKVDLEARLEGKKGTQVRWTEFSTTEPFGLVDLNRAIGKHMGATGYAFAAVNSPTEQEVQIRAGSNNSIKVFLNGQAIFAHEEYHHGQGMDQYVARGKLKAGRNEILVKVCQNEQTESWAQTWSFQLRVCDRLGGTVPVTVATDKVVTGGGQ